MKTRILLSMLALLLTVGLTPAAEKKQPIDVVYLNEGRPILIRLNVTIDGKPLMEVYNAFLEKTFKSLDTNGDGVLSKEEVERMIPVQTFFSGRGFGGFGGGGAVSSEALDKNKDGKVDLTEFTAYYRQQGFVPFQLLTGEQDPYQGRVVFAGGGGGGNPASAEAINQALFKLLDTDKDGKLSKEELAKAPDLIAKLDVDDDEILTVAELMGEAPASDNPYGGVAFVGGGGGMQQGNRNFVLVTPGEPATNLVRALLAKYAPKAKKLTQKDLGLDKETFARLDQDEDGELDAEELAHFTDRPADLELTMRVGKRDRKDALVEVVEPAGSNKSGATVKQDKEGLAIDFGITRLMFGKGNNQEEMFAPAPAKERNKQRYTQIFTQADADNNGYLDMKEVERTGFFTGSFKAMDADGDGKLYLKEILAFAEKMEAQQAEAQASCVSLSVSDQGRGLFDLIDLNRDSRLGTRELRQVAKLLSDLDRDKDGFLTTTEVPRSYQMSIRQGNGGGDPFAPLAVRIGGRGGVPSLPSPTAGPLWFRKMDRNRDGDVSRKEFLGTDEEFKRIDEDGDGLISVAEAEKFDEMMRKSRQ